MSCDVATTSPASVLRDIFFSVSNSTLTPSQILDVEAVVHSWHAARTNPTIRVDGFASTEGPDELNWRLSCDRAFAVANELVFPSSGTPGIPANYVEIFAQGETSEWSGSLAPNRRVTISTISPLPAPICTHPGESRTLDLQPVFFRNDPTDAAPTGVSWVSRFNESNDIWGKLGVTFRALSTITLDDAVHKIAGSNRAERDAIRATHNGAGIEVFLVDNDMADAGGGGTVGAGTAGAKVALSDRGTSNTLLAHELGHVLGLQHPGDGTPNDGEAGTIMEGSGSHNALNPTRNTMVNYSRILFPPASGSTCLNPIQKGSRTIMISRNSRKGSIGRSQRSEKAPSPID
jgi:hypothetical protein